MGGTFVTVGRVQGTAPAGPPFRWGRCNHLSRLSCDLSLSGVLFPERGRGQSPQTHTSRPMIDTVRNSQKEGFEGLVGAASMLSPELPDTPFEDETTVLKDAHPIGDPLCEVHLVSRDQNEPVPGRGTA